MGPDPRIADYIRQHKDRYTRQAIREQLIEAGHEPEAIDRTWAVLDMPDPDDVIGRRFWSRFWMVLIGINVAVFLLVALASGMLMNLSGYSGMLVILAIVLTIFALIAWGVVGLTGPSRMRRVPALIVGVTIPLFFALLVGGTCYALIGAVGPPPPPPIPGTVTIHIEPPLPVDATTRATCEVSDAGHFYNVFTDVPVDTDAGQLTVSVNGQGDASSLTDTPFVSISFNQGKGQGGFVEYQPGGGENAGIEAAAISNATNGSLAFENFLPIEAFDEQGNPIDRFDADPISGTISWSCES
jgi:hypothetical protein